MRVWVKGRKGAGRGGAHHFVCLVELHLDAAQGGLLLFCARRRAGRRRQHALRPHGKVEGRGLTSAGVGGIAVELVAYALEDLLEVLFVRVEEGGGRAVHRGVRRAC